jgi:DNA-binding transcriptional ArsR family regulator
VLICLRGFSDTEGFCWPSVGTIASELGRTRSTIRHHLNWLVAHGYITKDPMPRKDGSQGANRYCTAGLGWIEPNAAPVDQHAAAAAVDRQPASRAQQASLLLPIDGGAQRTAGRRSNRKTPPPARRRRAGLIAATALAEIEGWAK